MADSGAPNAVDPVSTLTRVLSRAVRALGDAGQPDPAMRFAAEAWSALRLSRPDDAEQLNRAMHYISARAWPKVRGKEGT